ncbi:Uncharacterised protein [Bordetella pertussis]|nr:Uncharacterised protein [Bordetella pertussis]CFW15346.1 Uncharacterised protein [Bordetella pertussis]
MGTPPARPLARVMTSGRISAHWWANHLPVRPIPDCTSSIMSSQPRSVHSCRTPCRNAMSEGRMPPSPCRTSSSTAVTRGSASPAARMAGRSL